MSETQDTPEVLEDVRGKPLGLLAQQEGDVEGMSRVLPGFNSKRVAVAAFQSSI